jgi:hypothetical protein
MTNPEPSKHFDPRWDTATGKTVTLDGVSYSVLRCRVDSADPNDDRVPPQAKQWKSSPLRFTNGRIGGPHDIVYLGPREYVRVPRT